MGLPSSVGDAKETQEANLNVVGEESKGEKLSQKRGKEGLGTEHALCSRCPREVGVSRVWGR